MRVPPDPKKFAKAVLSSEVQELGTQNGNLTEKGALKNAPDAVLRVEQTHQTCTSARSASRGRAHTVHMEPLLQALL